LLRRADELRLLPQVPAALQLLSRGGFLLVVVSNQPIVARGIATEADVEAVHTDLQKMISAGGGPSIERFYFCPHHPNANLPAYRVNCECRKPKPGMLLQAARELKLDLGASFMIGDRITDIIAGAKAGCRTVLVHTGKHLDKPITTSEPIDPNIQPDWTCADLASAGEWILKTK
jgi:D-glycero-D-manno-heptose 1,7-bisphosphate phosphatase